MKNQHGDSNTPSAISSFTAYCSSHSTFSCSENTDFSSCHFDEYNVNKVECESFTFKDSCSTLECMDIKVVYVEEHASTFCTSKPHKSPDIKWEALQFLKSRDGVLGLEHFRILKKLGGGDIGNVYLAELRNTRCLFALKVMDKEILSGRGKQMRAETERVILSMLDHPFLPSLYSHFETDKFSCLLMEFCGGGNLYSLRQKQPGKRFTEQAARFYASEVLMALEYLHMMGVVYRDLKPENVLVRDDGHIMLTDFDLSLRCSVSPTLVKSSTQQNSKVSGYCIQPPCTEPACLQPTCFRPKFSTKNHKAKTVNNINIKSLPELNAEPTSARSMSFVGTHEYLAPEIIAGSGHGSAVDWWTFGIFLYELLYGRTPFKGNKGTRETLFNVVGQSLSFPQASGISIAAKDLIRGLLVKDPQKRLGYKSGATEIKRHAFFGSINWPLIRSIIPPEIPEPVDFSTYDNKPSVTSYAKEGTGSYISSSDHFLEFDIF